MNPNLAQLAYQAGITVNAESEKFAELIVRECADLFPKTFTDEQYQRRIDKEIKKHFGVIE